MENSGGLYRFKGQDASLGYRKGGVYTLYIKEGNIDLVMHRPWLWSTPVRGSIYIESLENPRGRCLYESQEAFNKNWERLEVCNAK